MLRKVRLYGQLGKRFGRVHELDVGSAAEAFRALTFQLPGFADYVSHRKYQVSVGEGQVIGAEQLPMRLGNGRDVHITPAGAVAGIETILLIGALVLTAALSVATILMMPKVPAPGSREEATKTSSFIFDGATNVTEQGHAIPLVYGRARTGSIVGSSGIATTDVTEATVSADPTAPYTGIGGGGAGGIDGYGGYVGSTPGVKDGFFGDEWFYLEKGGKAGGGTARAAQEDPNTLQSQATAKVLDVISEGEIVGLVDGLKSVYFDETPLQNADDSFNFAGVSVEQRVGLPDQDFIPGFTQTEDTTSVNTKVTVAIGPHTETITDPNVTVARVTIRLPQLYQQDTTNGDLKATSVTVAISVQADGGGYTEVTRSEFTGKTNSGYQRSIDVRLPNGTSRQVRVTRITADSAVSSLSNDTYFDLLTEIVEAKLSYPDSALIGLTVDARQFGSNIPNRSYDIKGIIVEVPTNYDPGTRVYTGVWDGTFKRAWTDNPAWVYRDIIVNRRYGLGARVPAEAVDKWGLYAIAQYNDELVPDMFGGTEPRYTINCVINNQAAAYDVIASIASNFRGWAYWGSGSVMAAQDRPEDPSILVTPSNVVDGVIEYGRVTPLERRRSVAVVWWNDPEDGGKLTPEIYEVPELVRRFGRRTGDPVTAFGVSRRGQAHRMCRWIIEDEAQSSNSTAAYGVGDDHGFVEPGRIAQVADPMFTTNRRGGRLVSALTNQVTIDAAFTVVTGQTYTLRVMLPNGTVSVRPVTNGAGAATVITLGGTAYATPPNPGAVWTIESNLVAHRQFRVRSITADDPPHKVQAVLHDPTKYARVEADRDISAPPFIDLPQGPLVPPSDVTAFEFLLQDGNASIPSVQVSWKLSADPRITFYQAQYKRPGGQWEVLADSLDTNRAVRGTEAGSWSFRVRGLDSLGNKTMWIQSDVTLDGQVDTLPDVTGLALLAADAGFTSKISWDPVDDVRPLRFEVLYNFANSLPGAVSLGLVDTTEYPVSVAGHYWIRTNFIAAYSPSPAHIEVTEAELTIAAALTPTLTNDSFNVPADSAGVVSSYSGASGSFVVLQGTSDVSSNFALSTVSGGNPQALTIGYVAQAYSVTAGLDAGEDTATVKIRATGSGAFAGIAIDKIFSLGKNKQGSTGAAGANAKTLTVQTDRTAFTFDGAANLTPGTQSAVVTANPQNFVGGNVVWSYVDNLGTSSATLATLVTATSTNVRTVPSAVFTGTPTRLWLRVVATGQGAESGISDSDIVYRLDAGSGVLTLIMSNPAHNVPTDSAGAGGDFTGAHGQLTAFYGTTDVTAAATLSEVSETSLTGDVNTATNSPVGSQPKGYYRVTALSADTGTYKMRAVYNPGSGNITVDQDFTVTKARQGSTGTSGVSPVLATPTVPLIVIRTYADGTPKPGQLPLDIGTVVTQAGSGISLTSLALVTQSNLTATEDNVNVTVSAISGTSGFVAYTATAGGQTVAVTVPYTTIPDGAAGGFATSQDFSGSISGASYTDASPTITMNVPASGQINVSLVGEYYVGTPAGNFLAAVKMRYQINGGGYGDVSGSAVTGSEALYISAGNPGNTVGSFNTGLLSITGLTPGDNFELRYQYKKSSGSKSATLDSAVTMYAEQE